MKFLIGIPLALIAIIYGSPFIALALGVAFALIHKNSDEIIDKSINIIEDESKIQSEYRQGIIGRVNVFIEPINYAGNQDTITTDGINFIFNKDTPLFNLKRLTKKILIRPGIPYKKGVFDKSYEALSELKNFKKIAFEFSQISSDNNKDILESDIFLTSGS